ncbi:MAG: hypothetical protein ACPGJS_23785 [Flammeovirgaceae bacterium]
MANQSSGKLSVVLFAVVAAAASYFILGIQSQYGVLMLVMIGFTFLLGLFGKIKAGTANFALASFLILGVGSVFIEQMGHATIAFGAKAVSIVIFIFIAISAIGTIIKILFGLGGIVLLIYALGYISNSNELPRFENEEELVYDDQSSDSTTVDQDVKTEEKPSDLLRSHARSWRDLQFNRYQGKLEVWENDFKHAKQNREKIRVRNARSSQMYWRQIYQKLITHDAEQLDRVLENFITIGRDQKLNQLEFAQMVVSCIQDIPYVLIYADPCSELANESAELQALAKKHACKGPVKYGLQSPTEFMYNLKGDCDTRTVFLFTILSRLGYKVCILNSDAYGHSMFGIDISGKGKYKDYRGNHYYFWETTAKGWDIGVLPPEMGQVQHWDVIVAN